MSIRYYQWLITQLVEVAQAIRVMERTETCTALAYDCLLLARVESMVTRPFLTNLLRAIPITPFQGGSGGGGGCSQDDVNLGYDDQDDGGGGGGGGGGSIRLHARESFDHYGLIDCSGGSGGGAQNGGSGGGGSGGLVWISTEAKTLNIQGEISLIGGEPGAALQPPLTQRGGRGSEGYLFKFVEVCCCCIQLMFRHRVSAPRLLPSLDILVTPKILIAAQKRVPVVKATVTIPTPCFVKKTLFQPPRLDVSVWFGSFSSSLQTWWRLEWFCQ